MNKLMNSEDVIKFIETNNNGNGKYIFLDHTEIIEYIETNDIPISEYITNSLLTIKQTFNNNISNNKLREIIDYQHKNLRDDFNKKYEDFFKNIEQYNNNTHLKIKNDINETDKLQTSLFKHYFDSMNNNLNEIKQNINERNNKIINNSSIKGKISEDNLEIMLNIMYPNTQIENTTKIGGCCDFKLFFSDCNIIIENKDHIHNVPKRDIIKFKNDVYNNNTHGLLLSQNSGISDKNNFEIEMNNNKNILLYIHNVQNNPDIIHTGIDIIRQLSLIFKENTNLDIDYIINKDILELIHNEYTQFLNKIEKYKNTAKYRYDEDIKMFNDMKFPHLVSLLSQHVRDIKCDYKYNYKCDYCGKIYKTKKPLNNHMEKCKKEQ